MIVIGLALLGVIMGVLSARRRQGNKLDMLQYGVGYAMAFAIVGMVITIIIDKAVG